MKKKILATSPIIAQALLASTAFAQTPTVSITVRPGGTIDEAIAIVQKFGGWLLMAAGALAVVFLVIGGIRYLISAGNSTQAEAAKKTIIYALIGLIIIVISGFAVNLVMSLFS